MMEIIIDFLSMLLAWWLAWLFVDYLCEVWRRRQERYDEEE